VWLAHILGIVTFENLNTHFLQSIGGSRTLQIGTGNAEAEIDQHFGNTRHADASDTDEMDVLNSAKH
jgi:hypothetical protein